MFLVKRKISPYTNSDIIIGIFDNNEIAIKAKAEYINKCKVFDKWAEQAYKNVNLELDTIIQEVLDFDYKSHIKVIFVVSRFDEAFGQIVRIIDKFLETHEETKKYCDIKNNEEDLESNFPFYYDYEQIEINKLYHDK